MIVDDDDAVTRVIAKALRLEGYATQEAESCRAALSLFREDPPDVTICDYQLHDGTALDLLPELRSIDPLAGVIVLTGHGSIDLAVRATVRRRSASSNVTPARSTPW